MVKGELCRYCLESAKDLRRCAVCGELVCEECRCQECYPSDYNKRIYATMRRNVHCDDCYPDMAFGKDWEGCGSENALRKAEAKGKFDL